MENYSEIEDPHPFGKLKIITFNSNYFVGSHSESAHSVCKNQSAKGDAFISVNQGFNLEMNLTNIKFVKIENRFTKV